MQYFPSPGPAGFLTPGCARPFLPPIPPFSSAQPPRGSFFPHLPPNFPPSMVSGQNLVPYILPQQLVPGGPNFQFPADPPPQWAPYPKRPPRNKHFRQNRNIPGENVRSGSSPGQPLFVCSPCHKEYKSQHTYDLHLATHVKCSKCDFECSKGAMHDHELIHYLPPELNFSSQEDIEKWRKERRRNFPTAANMLRKKQLLEKRERQGDMAGTPLYRYVSRVCGGGERGNLRQRGQRGNHWVVGSNRKCPPHPGGREWASEEGESLRPPWRGGRGGRRGKRGRGGRRGRNAYERKDFGGCGLKHVPAKKPTLLEKLLAREMRVEQNTLLQCVRHIVRSDFFRPPGRATREDEVKEGEGWDLGEGWWQERNSQCLV